MKVININSIEKVKLEREIKDYIANHLEDFNEFWVISKFAILADDMVFAVDKKIEINTIEAPVTDYIMIIEGSKFAFQIFNIAFFDADEIEEVAQLQDIFTKDEIRYMEVFDEEYEEIEV